MESLEDYIKWSNAIHAWGLGHNATSYQKDMEKLLRSARDPLSSPHPRDDSALTPPTSDNVNDYSAANHATNDDIG